LCFLSWASALRDRGGDMTWPNHALPNGGGPSRLQSAPLVAAVAELLSLGVAMRVL